MKFHLKKDDNSKRKEKRPLKEKATQVLKYIGAGAAVVAGGAAAIIVAGLASAATEDDKESTEYEFDPYYEPFADPNSPSYIETDSYGEIDWDDDEDPSDESYGAEDYYSSRPWIDE